jgi:hypothetical protein
MRYVVCGAVILACLLVATLATGRLPRVATATVNVSNNATVDVPKLRQTIDMKALPQQQLPD